jgi:hypothetical protein
VYQHTLVAATDAAGPGELPSVRSEMGSLVGMREEYGEDGGWASWRAVASPIVPDGTRPAGGGITPASAPRASDGRPPSW